MHSCEHFTPAYWAFGAKEPVGTSPTVCLQCQILPSVVSFSQSVRPCSSCYIALHFFSFFSISSYRLDCGTILPQSAWCVISLMSIVLWEFWLWSCCFCQSACCVIFFLFHFSCPQSGTGFSCPQSGTGFSCPQSGTGFSCPQSGTGFSCPQSGTGFSCPQSGTGFSCPQSGTGFSCPQSGTGSDCGTACCRSPSSLGSFHWPHIFFLSCIRMVKATLMKLVISHIWQIYFLYTFASMWGGGGGGGSFLFDRD